MCGPIFNAIVMVTIAGATVCTFTVPFRIGVHLDEGESLTDTKLPTDALTSGENIDKERHIVRANCSSVIISFHQDELDIFQKK